MTIDELLSLAALTANDEIPVWDAEAADEPTKKIKAQNLAASVKALSGLVGEAEFTEQLADKASAIVDTASGAIASFPDGAAVAAKDITIAIEPVQAGSGDPSPTNVRPISGWTGANVTQCGKNLLPNVIQNQTINGVTFTVNTDGSVTANGTASAGIVLFIKRGLLIPSGSYYMSGCPTGGSAITYGIRIGSSAFQDDISDYGQGRAVPIPSDATCNAYIFIANNYTCNNLTFYPQLELGSTATDYAPYTGTTYPISWQSEAGTVYGGTLDVITGLLTVTMAEVDLGTLNYSLSSSINVFYSQVPNMEIPTTAIERKEGIISSVYPVSNSTLINDSMDDKSMLRSYGDVYIRDTDYTSLTAFKAAMSGVQLVYELATPQTYQLAPTEVDTLLGENNVWADTGDSIVIYRADTKLYIQKINAPTDDDMIADAQIASGRYFIIGGNLYKSTTTIPAGDTITPGTNCILTNLADALNALNT